MHSIKLPLLAGLAIFAILTVTPLPIHSLEVGDSEITDEGVPTCSIMEFDPKCSPSGWVSFIIGDLTLAIIIAAMIYLLQRRTTNKLADAIMFMEKFLKHEEDAKRKQLIFVTQSLKNHFSTMLLIAGLMNNALKKVDSYDDIPAPIREKYKHMIVIASHANDALGIATHILDPMLTEQTRRFIDMVENVNPESGVGKGFPRYDAIKSDISSITTKLDTFIGNKDEILK